MSTHPILVGFDGTDASQRAIDFAADRAAEEGCPVHVVHILEWSPYSFLTPQELEERHKRRNEELARAEEMLAPAVKSLTDKGLSVTSEVRHGHAGELLCEIAKDKSASQIVISRKGGSVLGQRLLGSLALTLIQASPIAVTVVP